MLHSLKQIFIRILKVPSKIIFFASNCTFTTHQSFSFLFSTNVNSVYITFWGWSPLCIVRSFRVFLSNSFSLSNVHSNTLAPYLIIATAQLFIAFILFFPFNLNIKISLILLLYSILFSFPFLSLYHILVFQGIYILPHQSFSSTFHLGDSNLCF